MLTWNRASKARGACVVLAWTASILIAISVRAQVIDPTFPVVNGLIGRVMPLGDTLYVGGDFTWMGRANGSCVALDAVSGAVLSPWPRVQAGLFDGVAVRRASAAVPDGVGGCYVTGSFENISGVPRSRLAHIRGDGSVDGWNVALPSGWSPICITKVGTRLIVGGYLDASRPLLGAVDIGSRSIAWTAASTGSVVNVLAAGAQTIYAGGSFTALGGASRSNLAAIDVVTGLAVDWNPGANGPVRGLALNDSVVFAGGAFTQCGGASRPGLAALGPVSGLATSWSPAVGSSGITALALDGAKLFIAGVTSINGVSHGPLAELDTRTAAPFSWDPIPVGDIAALAVDGGRVYVGGMLPPTFNSTSLSSHLAVFDADTGVRQPWQSDADLAIVGLAVAGGRLFAVGAAACGGQRRRHAGSIDLASGQVTGWDPQPDKPIATFAASGSVLYVGGYFTQIAGQPRNGLAAFDRGSGALLAWNPAAGLAGVQVEKMAIQGNTLVVTGWAGSTGSSSVVAALDPGAGPPRWTATVQGSSFFQITAAFTLGSKVYLLGDFQSVNGTPRRSAAALEVSSGALTSWDAQISGTCWTGIGLGDVVMLHGALGTVAGQSVFQSSIVVDTLAGVRVSRPVPQPSNANVLALDGGTLYAAGRQSFSDPPPYPNTETQGFDVSAGSVTPWYVGIRRAFAAPLMGASSVAARSGHVWIAGDFDLARDAMRGGLSQVLPADATPPIVSVETPSPAPLTVGSRRTLSWSAADEQRVLSVDLLLSRSGPSGPWDLIAGGLEGVATYEWATSGPPSTDCWLGAVARDLAGNSASATSAASFAIVDSIAPVSVGGPDASAGVVLARPSPSPTGGRATIAYELATTERVSVTVHDLQGRVMAVLERGIRERGRHVLAIDAARLRPGMYLVRLDAGGQRQQQRLFVIR